MQNFGKIKNRIYNFYTKRQYGLFRKIGPVAKFGKGGEEDKGIVKRKDGRYYSKVVNVLCKGQSLLGAKVEFFEGEKLSSGWLKPYNFIVERASNISDGEMPATDIVLMKFVA